MRWQMKKVLWWSIRTAWRDTGMTEEDWVGFLRGVREHRGRLELRGFRRNESLPDRFAVALVRGVKQPTVTWLDLQIRLTPSPAPKFGHGVDIELESGLRLIAAFHPSQQNTFTGKLTPAMFDAVLAQAKKRALDAEGYGNQEANRG